jgi:hypothetical protein
VAPIQSLEPKFGSDSFTHKASLGIQQAGACDASVIVRLYRSLEPAGQLLGVHFAQHRDAASGHSVAGFFTVRGTPSSAAAWVLLQTLEQVNTYFIRC